MEQTRVHPGSPHRARPLRGRTIALNLIVAIVLLAIGLAWARRVVFAVIGMWPPEARMWIVEASGEQAYRKRQAILRAYRDPPILGDYAQLAEGLRLVASRAGRTGRAGVPLPLRNAMLRMLAQPMWQEDPHEFADKLRMWWTDRGADHAQAILWTHEDLLLGYADRVGRIAESLNDVAATLSRRGDSEDAALAYAVAVKLLAEQAGASPHSHLILTAAERLPVAYTGLASVMRQLGHPDIAEPLRAAAAKWDALDDAWREANRGPMNLLPNTGRAELLPAAHRAALRSLAHVGFVVAGLLFFALLCVVLCVVSLVARLSRSPSVTTVRRWPRTVLGLLVALPTIVAWLLLAVVQPTDWAWLMSTRVLFGVLVWLGLGYGLVWYVAGRGGFDSDEKPPRPRCRAVVRGLVVLATLLVVVGATGAYVHSSHPAYLPMPIVWLWASGRIAAIVVVALAFAFAAYDRTMARPVWRSLWRSRRAMLFVATIGLVVHAVAWPIVMRRCVEVGSRYADQAAVVLPDEVAHRLGAGWRQRYAPDHRPLLKAVVEAVHSMGPTTTAATITDAE